MNRFFTEKLGSETQALLTCYSDILCLFAAGVNNQELATVAIEQLRSLLVAVG